MKQNNSIIIYL